MYIFSFEKLEVWVEAKEFSKNIYAITAKFPDTEKFGLISQLRKQLESVTNKLNALRNYQIDKSNETK